MNVTELIEDLQEIANSDPATEIIVIGPAGAARGSERDIANVEYVDESTLTRPVAAIFTKLRSS